jgi:hypothetical protein
MKLVPGWLRGRAASASRTPVIQIEVTSRCQTHHQPLPVGSHTVWLMTETKMRDEGSS